MAAPNASYSVRIRIEADNTPGTLGRVTTAIGAAGPALTRFLTVNAEIPGPATGVHSGT